MYISLNSRYVLENVLCFLGSFLCFCFDILQIVTAILSGLSFCLFLLLLHKSLFNFVLTYTSQLLYAFILHASSAPLLCIEQLTIVCIDFISAK